MLAEALDADFLLVLTDVPAVMSGYGTPECRPIRCSSPHELRSLDLPPGSMGPKVEAVCRFVELTGGAAAVGALGDAAAIVRGDAGTMVTASGGREPGPRAL